MTFLRTVGRTVMDLAKLAIMAFVVGSFFVLGVLFSVMLVIK